MSFYGNSFIYNRIPCENFGLVLYNIEDKTNGGNDFSSVTMVEDKTNLRMSSLHYGINYANNLKFNLVFGVLDGENSLDFYDTSVIAGWLLGHSQYKWLEICQSDMSWIRYKCLITSIEKISVTGMSVAFSCAVECNSPFAYTYPQTQSISVTGTTIFTFKNISSYNGYLYPTAEFTPSAGTNTLTIRNNSEGGRLLSISGIKANSIITLDGDNQIIKDTLGTNLYEGFNDNFLRCIRGDNVLEITGNGVLKIISEFPINVGA